MFKLSEALRSAPKLFPLLSFIALVSGSLSGTALAQSQIAIPGVIAAGARVELVREGFQGIEGPVSDGKGGLYFTDIPANRIYHLSPTDDITVARDNTQGTNGLFVMPDGRILGAEGGGRRIVAFMPDMSVRGLTTAPAAKPLRGPNDLMPDRKGGVYFTDPAPRPAPDVTPKEFGDLYYMRANGEVLFLDGTIRRPNGLTLSPDERILYVDDTEGDTLYAFDVQPDGSVKNKRAFAKFLELEKGPVGQRSRADGLALDAEGRLYVGTAAGVQVISPKGEHLGIIRVPAVARNVAFAGAKKQTLYMTTLNALYRVEMLAAGPAARAK